MVSKKHFGRIMNIFLCFFLSIALSSVALVYQHEFSLAGLVIAFVGSFAISYFICDLIPVGDLGGKFAKALHLKEHGFGFALASTLIVCIIMVTLTSFFSTLISLGLKPILFLAWLSIYPYWMLVGYICLLILIPIAVKLAEALTKE